MDEITLDDPADLAALYDPVRYRLFRLLEQPQSVPELAAAIGLPANRLYYHVRRLVRCGVVRQVDARVNGKHTERIYGRAAKRIRFSGEAHVTTDPAGPLAGIVEEVEAGLRGASDLPALLAWHTQRIPPERAEELERRVKALLAEYVEETGPDDAPRYGVLTVLTPLS